MKISQLSRSPRFTQLMVLCFGLLVVGLSSIPAHRMPSTDVIWRWDKLIHACEYGLGATLVFRAWIYFSKASEKPRSLLRVALGTLLLCAFFGVFDELYQSTVPGRDSSGFDVLADIVGASFACIGSAVYYSNKRSRSDDHSKVCR